MIECSGKKFSPLKIISKLCPQLLLLGELNDDSSLAVGFHLGSVGSTGLPDNNIILMDELHIWLQDG